MEAHTEIELNRPVILGRILPATIEAWRELLNVAHTPRLNIKIRSGPNLYAIEESRDAIDRDWLEMWLDEREDDDVSLLFYVQTVDGEPRQLAGAGVISDNPMDYALVAAVTVAMARLTCGALVDSDASYTDTREPQSPDSFVAKVRLAEPQDDVERAAHLFYDRTVKAQYERRSKERRDQ